MENKNLSVEIHDGYFSARILHPTDKRFKIKVNDIYYDLNNNGKQEFFPFQFGETQYRITLYRQVTGTKYTADGRVTVTPHFSSKDAPFLCQNQYVRYDDSSEPVLWAKGNLLDLEMNAIPSNIRHFIKANFSYDYIKACKVSKKGVLPDIDSTWQNRAGICQDLAALAVCLLRTCQIPAKLVIGHADKKYHAWVEFELNGRKMRYDPTVDVGALRKPNKYIKERWY